MFSWLGMMPLIGSGSSLSGFEVTNHPTTAKVPTALHQRVHDLTLVDLADRPVIARRNTPAHLSQQQRWRRSLHWRQPPCMKASSKKLRVPELWPGG